MSEKIVIEIDDAALDESIAKLEGAASMKGDISEMSWEANQADMYMRSMDMTMQEIPSMNREMRMMLGHIPGVREGLMLMNRFKALQRDMSEGFGGAEFAMSPNVMLDLIVLAIMLFTEAGRLWEEAQKARTEYRALIREYTGLKTIADIDRWITADEQKGNSYLSGVPP